ncbi:hypothetical protein LCGC14_0194940 [marine sediment metagenome]|uniref:Uncharacterized protein n=1 Tax=marine sediment metagenome TaxID=412755 RepID=A0A0F9V1R3_9ZZZZ
MRRSVKKLDEFYKEHNVVVNGVQLAITSRQQEIVTACVAENGFQLKDIKKVRQMGHGSVAIDLMIGKTLYTENSS